MLLTGNFILGNGLDNRNTILRGFYLCGRLSRNNPHSKIDTYFFKRVKYGFIHVIVLFFTFLNFLNFNFLLLFRDIEDRYMFTPFV